jgi:hypothetical protein
MLTTLALHHTTPRKGTKSATCTLFAASAQKKEKKKQQKYNKATKYIPNGTGRVEHQGLVLSELDGVGTLLVDRTLVNGIGDGIVDELAHHDAGADGAEERVAILGNGEETLEVLVLLENVVDPVKEGNLAAKKK